MDISSHALTLLLTQSKHTRTCRWAAYWPTGTRSEPPMSHSLLASCALFCGVTMAERRGRPFVSPNWLVCRLGRSPPRPRRRRTPAVLLLQIAGTLGRGKWNGVEGLRITIMPRYSSVLCVRRPERASLIGWNINMKR